MKKFSFSLIGLLTIVLAVSSAFTSKPTFATDRWERFGVTPNSVTSSSTATQIFNQKLSDLFAATFTSSHTNINTEISTFNAGSSKDVSCAADLVNLCAVIESYDSNNPSVKTLVDYTQGDYAIQP